MKTTIRSAAWIAIAASTLPLAGLPARAQEIKTVAVAEPFSGSNSDPTAAGGGGGGGSFSFSSSGGPSKVVIQSIEPDGDSEPARDVTWLGLAVEESPEALSSQLGLKAGEGLIVNFVAPGSPAEKADFRKNDVLVELDGQMLVDALQLRKLVEMHAEGESVKLTFFRGGQKQTIDVKLGKRAAGAELGKMDDMFRGAFPKFKYQMGNLDSQMRIVKDQMARAGLDKTKMNDEIQRTIDQTVKAIEESLSHVTNDPMALSNATVQLEALAHNGVDEDKDSTVTVRTKHNSSRTIVKTDDDGTIVLVAGDKQHLTARDKDGQVLFDGDIDTSAEQDKVPKAVWEKVKPLLN